MSPDGRRVGHAQRRRIGAPSNVYDDTVKPPSFGVGDVVRVGRSDNSRRRYGDVTVTDVVPGLYGRPDGNDGHGYVVSGGKSGRQSVHASSQLMASESGACPYCGGHGMAGSEPCPSCGGSGHAGG